LAWGREVRGDGWPAGMFGLSWHSYGPYPHAPWWKMLTTPVEREFRALTALADGLPIFISEFGWANTSGSSELQQAEEARKLWALLTRCLDPWGLSWFQIHDGPDPTMREHRYGTYRCDAQGNIGDLKPVAYTVPKEDPKMVKTEHALSRKHAIPHPTVAGAFTWPHPDGDGSVLSVQPDGSIEKRPKGTSGEYETGVPEGSKAVFRPQGKSWAILLVD
jgi:hypothetical protein